MLKVDWRLPNRLSGNENTDEADWAVGERLMVAAFRELISSIAITRGYIADCLWVERSFIR